MASCETVRNRGLAWARAVRSEVTKTWHGVARFNPDARPPRRIFDASRLLILHHAYRRALIITHISK
jgi:hypothetical protein